MPASVHGHAVLEMLLAASRPLSRGDLRGVVDREFGRDARFHTCSASGMGIDDLIAFLIDRGKVTETGGCLSAHRELMCDDG
ncbi:MAG TPA: YecH family metal-binding protein [Chthonomonadales bacterium]|nr:YecH family metal-binding protein [Chthonomonadales bacterium]